MHWTVYNKAICNLLLKVIKVSYIKRTLTFTSIYVRQENSERYDTIEYDATLQELIIGY